MSTLQPGLYRHFKGKNYFVLGVGKIVTNGAPEHQVVIYRNENLDFFVRSKEEFLQLVPWPEFDGKLLPRWITVESYNKLVEDPGPSL